MGVRVDVGVADNAAINTCILSVLAAEVARAPMSTVGVRVCVEVWVIGCVVGEKTVDVTVADGG
jgi:hypothetical protein